MKTVLYRVFGIGRIPEPLLAELKSEGILLLDEGIRGSITYHDFRAPGRYSNWKRQWFTASIALTKARLILQKYSRPFINLSFTDERIHKLQFTRESDGVLLIAFDAAPFLDNSSGRIECRFRTPQARLFVDALQDRVSGLSTIRDEQ